MSQSLIVVEHLENGASPWSLAEYKHAAENIEKLIITNFECNHDLNTCVKIYNQSVFSLAKIEDICILDSEADETLLASDAYDFKYFVIGGILGNVDEFDEDRTKLLRKEGVSRKNLGAMQMTLDTAAIVCDIILHKGIDLENIRFIDLPVFKISLHESVQMNFRYLDNGMGEPLVSKEVLQILKNNDDFDILELV